jgi:hypothetical protein
MTNFKRFMMMMVAIATLSFSACKKDKFDEPPGNTTDPNLDTISIARLKAYYTGGSPVSIPDDVNIAGLVIANDETANFYKTIIIDDGNQAISISIDVSAGLYNDFPVGRKIYVKCKDLALGTYGGTPQLGGYVDGSSVGRIAQALIPKFIVKGPIGNDVTPLIQHVKIAQLNDSYLSRLIQLDSAEFDVAAADIPYADVNKPIPDDGDRIVKNCGNSTPITVRTSPYSSFAFAKTPKGNGSIIGVYSKYGTFTFTKQLAIRDTSDVNMRGIKCDGSDPNAAVILEEKFGTVTDFVDIAVNGWSTFKSAGTKNWVGRIGGTVTDPYAQMSAFGSPNEASNISWLISPSINLNTTTNEILSFSSYAGFNSTPAVLELLYSTNYSGSGDPSLATWINLSATISNTNSWISSGAISLNSITSTSFYFAFKYIGGYSPTVATTQFRVDNIRVTGL